MEELQGKVSTQKSLLELDFSNLYGLNFCLEHNWLLVLQNEHNFLFPTFTHMVHNSAWADATM